MRGHPTVYILSVRTAAVAVRRSSRFVNLRDRQIEIRHPSSKSCLQHYQTVIQPCMWILHDGTGQALCYLAYKELAWLFHEPHTGLDDCLRMLQACSRDRMSDRDGSPSGPESESIV